MSCRQSLTYDGSSIGIPFHDRMQSPIRNGDLRSLTSITTTSGIHVGVRIFFNERETTSVVKSQLDTTQDQGYNGDTVSSLSSSPYRHCVQDCRGVLSVELIGPTPLTRAV